MRTIEFYTYDDEVWCRYEDGKTEKLSEHNIVLVNGLFDMIKNGYTDAFSALETVYGNSRPNRPYYRYVVVRRFIKCNFSKMDGTYLDIDKYSGRDIINPEKVECPIRGECPFEGRICLPRYNTKLTDKQMEVARLLYEGKSKDEIAEDLLLSWDTINNHIRNIFAKLGVHSDGEFMRYVISHKIF